MMICYDKAFPESARTLTLDGAEVLACLSAWPTSLTNRAPRMAQDRQACLFHLYDQARAAENQIVLVSSNQTGVLGELRFLGQAKVVGPGGRSWPAPGPRPVSRRPSWTWQLRSPRPAGCCGTSTSASRASTGST